MRNYVQTCEQCFFVHLCIFAMVCVASCGPVFAYILPGTGQTRCYDNATEIICPQPGQPFYGQDGNYKGVQPSYHDNGNGTVTDRVTNLMWQLADDGIVRIWEDSVSYCENLALGGHDDWRLPSALELLTIVDNGRDSPAVNPSFSCSNSSAYYWTSTVFPNPQIFAWHVVFSHGYSDYSLKSFTYNVRCVRGKPLPDSVYTDNGTTVTDQTTGLIWEKDVSAPRLSWEESLAWCINATTGGYDDWRLPNIRELESLVVYSLYYPAFDPIFTGPLDPYWSSTSLSGAWDNAWMLNTFFGTTMSPLKNSQWYARCVRGGRTSYNPGVSPLLLFQDESLGNTLNVGPGIP